MNVTSNFTFRNTVRSVEWIIIISSFLQTLLNTGSINYSAQPFQVVSKLILLTIAAGMSTYFPINAPILQRKIYIFINLIIAILFFNVGLGSSGIDLLVYIAVAKSGLLLKRRDAIMTAIITGIACIVIYILNIPNLLEYARDHIPENNARLYDTNRVMKENITYVVTSFFATYSFVILFSCSMAEEQKNRQRAESLAKEVESLAARLERTRIAREIHDVLGHSLTTLNIQLELAQRLYLHNPEKGITSLNVAKQLANECLADVQKSVHGWRQEDFDLTMAIHKLVQQIQHNSEMLINLDVNLPAIPLQISHQIYYILQEGLTNIQKHANTKIVYLKGLQTSDTILLELIDEGCGFDPYHAHQGFGLRGMEERVQLIGGSFYIGSTPGQGTQIQVAIPYDSTFTRR
jgi:signal transduction histidine kinase